MMQKKICLLGGFAVGKTSLVRRFVHSLYAETYHTSIGVTVEKKTVAAPAGDVTLMLWDLYGEDELQSVRMSYLRGAAGYVLVVDGTRPQTLVTAGLLHDKVRQEIGTLPFVLMLNKADLAQQWQLDEHSLQALARASLLTIRTSARTGKGVDEAFACLAGALAAPRQEAAR